MVKEQISPELEELRQEVQHERNTMGRNGFSDELKVKILAAQKQFGVGVVCRHLVISQGLTSTWKKKLTEDGAMAPQEEETTEEEQPAKVLIDITLPNGINVRIYE